MHAYTQGERMNKEKAKENMFILRNKAKNPIPPSGLLACLLVCVEESPQSQSHWIRI
jgi:hypothetical protein